MVISYLNAVDAAALDVELMSQPGFSLEQLMELAGLAVAQAVYKVVAENNQSAAGSILVVCGPGNNGGDGLVAARHLVHFGYSCTVVYPKRSLKQHFINLQQQCVNVGIRVVDDLPDDLSDYGTVVDAIFGFSFLGEPREPFASILERLKLVQDRVISVDVPSGWHVDDGDVAGTGFLPAVLVSLTAPKQCARAFTGRHFVGGRFLPPALVEKYNILLPPYPACSQIAEIATKPNIHYSWEMEYASFCAERESALTRDECGKDEERIDSWEAQCFKYLEDIEAQYF